MSSERTVEPGGCFGLLLVALVFSIFSLIVTIDIAAGRICAAIRGEPEVVVNK